MVCRGRWRTRTLFQKGRAHASRCCGLALSHGFVLHIKLTSLQLSSLDIIVQEKNTDTPQKTGTRKLKRQQTNTIKTHMARSDFWVTIPFNVERLEQHHYQYDRKPNVIGVLEKIKISNRVPFAKIWVAIAIKWCHTQFYIRPNNLPPGIVLEIRRQDLALNIVVLTMTKF